MGLFCSKNSSADDPPSRNSPILDEPCAEMKSIEKTRAEGRTTEKHSSEVARGNESKSNGTGSTASGKKGMPLPKVLDVRLEKAVDVLDNLGSGWTSSLNSRNSFQMGLAAKGKTISILAFEVANTIAKGSNLMQSLSRENIEYLKDVVLESEGVQCLISRDIKELLGIVAADKREELKAFAEEVVRFGNQCIDPQWHNLDRYFSKLYSDSISQKKLKEEAPGAMQHLMTLVQTTADLYNEMYDLGKFEHYYQQRLKEQIGLPVHRGDELQVIKQELKTQKKHVKSLKKKSLWSKSLEEIVATLVDIVHFLHLEICETFEPTDQDINARNSWSHQRLGSVGLALHYANIISLIDILVLQSSSMPKSTRDALYHGLPPSIKSALRAKLQSIEAKEELTITQTKAEIEKTLMWLVQIANNTIRLYQSFGRIGEWANTGTGTNRATARQSNVFKIETLHYADRAKTETYILDLVVWLHQLIIQRRVVYRSSKAPNASPTSPAKGSSSFQIKEVQETLPDDNLKRSL
ncbi:protein PSK SIMULATOR 1-like [Curcuma longa]|uniref:protein PSK SIMULATOR 1-like n=1 Tax=Curcuma longa TaxID=136217 RepID=UPI003D9E7EA2